MDTTHPIQAWLAEQRPQWETWLHTIHQRPETGFEENHTAQFVAACLHELKIECITGIGKTGVVGILPGTAGTGRRIAFRAELDALPMQECSGVHYHSRIAGKFHGCGHDGHTTTLLAAAAYLAAHRDFAGTAIFIFQPAEELLSGAQAMLAEGLFERCPCDEIYALHNLPGLGKGKVGIPAAGALASADHVEVLIKAKGTHGSAPHTGQDAILASAHFLTSLQQSLTRILDSRDSGVISFGSIHAGQANNILPEELLMTGTIRTHSETVRARLHAQLQQAADSTALLYGVRVAIHYPHQAPVTLNHPQAVEAVQAVATRLAGAEQVIMNARPLMASEDFSYFLQQIPGAYFFMGQDGPYCHHPQFIFDTDIIPLGASLIAELIRQQAARPTTQ
ncbi:hippurate hydrolase [Thiothrix eikelboomii]|uniref:Hippurate hydrolase n=1 Tax=Thiothrix eikelboomii TaxID=92487 RepID=A0A1T4W3R4_9GAMM|nr:amidohydrolase [Thiothrix eikelboomii]SKA71863.1 hippurate hydrolase [Thiothrix eikelboomii]